MIQKCFKYAPNMLQICSKYASNVQYKIGAIFRGCVLTAIIFSTSLEKTLLPKIVVRSKCLVS
jgi:hypothetical protein